MTTYYIDPVLGSDSNDALSFATAGKSLNNAAMNAALLGGDEVRIVETPAQPILGANAKFNQQTPPLTAESYTVSAATATSPIVITTSVNHNFATNDWVSVTGANPSTFGALGMWKVTVLSPTTFSLNNSIGVGTYTSGGLVKKRSGSVVEFSTPQVKNICCNGTVTQTTYPYLGQLWTPSAGANCSSAPNNMQGTGNCIQFGVTASFTTGKIGYLNLGTSLDLSAYTHLNAFIGFATSSGAIADGDYYVALCSDTIGAVIVDQFDLNQVTVAASSGVGMRICQARNGGGALGSAIQSIALYRKTNTGSANITFENFTAGTAPVTTSNVNIKSVISPDGTGYWWALSVLTQDYAILAASGQVLSATYPTYYPLGSTGFGPTNKIDGFTSSGNVASGVIYQLLTLPAPDTNITFSGGWTRSSSMSTKNAAGMSLWYNGSALGVCVNAGLNIINLSFENLGFANFNTGLVTQTTSRNMYINDCHFINCNVGANLSVVKNMNLGLKIDGSQGGNYFTQCFASLSSTLTLSVLQNMIVFCNTGSSSISIGSGSTSNSLNNIYLLNCGGANTMSITSSCNNIENVTIQNCYGGIYINFGSGAYTMFRSCAIYSNIGWGTTGLSINGNANTFIGCTIDSCNVGVNMDRVTQNEFISTAITNCTNAITVSNACNNNFNKCTGLTFPGTAFYSATAVGSNVSFTNCTDNLSNTLDGIYYVDNCYVKKTTDVTHSGSSSWGVYVGPYANLYGWKNEYNPVRNSLSKVKCLANRTYTISVWVNRSDAAGQNAYLCVLGGQIAGISTDAVSPLASQGSGVWEQLTVTVTPTINGVFEVHGVNYGSSSQLIYWDDISIVEA